MMRRITGQRYALLIAAALLAGRRARPVAPPALRTVRPPSQTANARETAEGEEMPMKSAQLHRFRNSWRWQPDLAS
jgi:hypothetical protein